MHNSLAGAETIENLIGSCRRQTTCHRVQLPTAMILSFVELAIVKAPQEIAGKTLNSTSEFSIDRSVGMELLHLITNPCPVGSFKNEMSALGHEPVLGITLLLELLPSVVVENNVAAAYDAVEQVLKRGDLCGR